MYWQQLTLTSYFLVHLSEHSQEASATYSPRGIDYCSIIVQQIDKKHLEAQCKSSHIVPKVEKKKKLNAQKSSTFFFFSQMGHSNRMPSLISFTVAAHGNNMC